MNKVVAPSRLPARTAELTASIAAARRENLLRTKAKIVGRAGIELGPTLDL